MKNPESARRHRDHSRLLPPGDLDDLPASSRPQNPHPPEKRQDDLVTQDYVRTLRVK